MPDENPFQPLPGATAEPAVGEPSRTAHEIATAAAAAAVRAEPGPGAAAPGSQFQEMVPAANQPALESPEAQHMEPVPEPPLPGDPPVQTPATPQPAPVAEPGTPLTFTQEDYQALQEAGIDLPVAPADVAPEFHGAYAQLAQAVMDAHHVSNQQIEDAQTAILKVQAFTSQLQTPEGQERVLLGMAMSNPDTFTKAMETVQRMNEDPAFRDSMLRSLEADAKLEAAQRMEQAVTTTRNVQKGAQVEARTVRLANRLGVDPQTAKSLIVNKIYENEARTGTKDISFAEVDAIVQGLATRMGSRAPVPVSTPATQQLAAQIPPTAGQAPGQTPPDPTVQHAPRPDVAVPSTHALDRLRGAVKQASQNARASGL